jgi:hypothetical protein
MCKTDERTHKHHIIPRYMGGTDDPKNLVEVTITQHAMFHFCNYQLWGNEEDRLAWRGLAGLITPDEAALQAQILNGRRNGNKTKENKTGIFGLSPEEKRENSRKGGITQGNRHKENKTGVCGRTPEKIKEDGRKGGITQGNRNRENKTGIFGRSPEKMSEDGRKAAKAQHAQKWQCTETGYVSNSGSLTTYQNKRGIDTSKRIKVDGPKIWEITFEDGRVIVIYQNLKDWAKENGYTYDSLRKVRAGKIKNHKGIIKVVPL